MTDMKSKIPDINELGAMAGKLFHDIKHSVSEIIDDYKKKHPNVVVVETKPTDIKTHETDIKKPDDTSDTH